jgi:putative aldouronate transport system permease protein
MALSSEASLDVIATAVPEAEGEPSGAPRRTAGSRRDPGVTVMQLVLLVVAIAFLVPLLVVISTSFSSEDAVAKDGYSLFPRDFTFYAYQYILSNPLQILRAYGVSIVVTVVGTVVSLTVMSMLAYTLSRRDYRWRKPLSFVVLLTMLFGPGLVPSYILITQTLNLDNTLLALIAPYLVTPWYVLLLRTFFSQLPQEVLDAAMIDGASEWQIFTRIAIPLAKPALATVGLFVVLLYWNDWWLGLLYIQDSNLVPVQLYLYRIISNIDFIVASDQMLGQLRGVPIVTARMAAAVLAIGPIIVAFFYVQRFLIKGITVGGVKD